MEPTSETGESAVTAVFGVGIFLLFLLLAAQTLVHLSAASQVQAVTFDAARQVAGAQGIAPGQAEAQARDLLGGYGSQVTFSWGVTADGAGTQTTLTVRGPSPARLVRVLAVPVEARVQVRDEDLPAP